MIPKNKAWRSPKYLAWVRTLPCCICGRPAGEAHHIKGIGHMSGIGIKASDAMTMPLCREHHSEMHQDMNMQPDQFEYICRTLGRAIDEGVLK